MLTLNALNTWRMQKVCQWWGLQSAFSFVREVEALPAIKFKFYFTLATSLESVLLSKSSICVPPFHNFHPGSWAWSGLLWVPCFRSGLCGCAVWTFVTKLFWITDLVKVRELAFWWIHNCSGQGWFCVRARFCLHTRDTDSGLWPFVLPLLLRVAQLRVIAGETARKAEPDRAAQELPPFWIFIL